MAVPSLQSKGRRVSSRWPFVAFLSVLVLWTVSGCSSPGAAQDPGPKPQRDVLSRDEILKSNAHQSDLLQAIRSLRPEFLAPPRNRTTPRGTAMTPLTVYVEGVRQAGPESLRNIAASQILEVRYLDPTASASQFGPTAGGGAIVVKVFQNDRTPLDG
jgi:hypothetical protein